MRRPGSRGTFQQLGQFVGVGFDGKDPKAVEALCAHDPDEGIFVWTPESIKGLEKGGNLETDKKLGLVSYLCKLVYQLCMSVDDNVSESPGFGRYVVYGKGPAR
jgi:hypothetical protein